ncbi:MAG: hypothetical protein ACRD18_08650 [Terriglobia bacterium]
MSTLKQHNNPSAQDATFIYLRRLSTFIPLLGAVRGHHSRYVGGTLARVKQGETGRLRTSDSGLIFESGKVTSVTIPYNEITAMDYGEHAGRRVGLAIAVAWPLLFSHKKRHYLTIYFTKNPQIAAQERAELAKDPKATAKGDVAAFEVNKHDYAELMSILQAKTGVAVQEEGVKR